jgi:hypothetical protein
MRFDGWCQAHTEVTAAAGRALGADAASWRYVRARQGTDGSWPGYWWSSPHYATWQSVELAHAVGDDDAVAHAGDWALGTLADNDTAFRVGLGLAVLVRAGRSSDRAIAQLCALQDADGGWPGTANMRIPLPPDRHPDRRTLFRRGGRGLPVPDHRRVFTAAVCVSALALALDA